MKYLAMLGRLLTVTAICYLPYAVFIQLPTFIGELHNRNKFVPKSCVGQETFCNWLDGSMFMIVAGIGIVVTIFAIAVVYSITQYVITGQKP